MCTTSPIPGIGSIFTVGLRGDTRLMISKESVNLLWGDIQSSPNHHRITIMFWLDLISSLLPLHFRSAHSNSNFYSHAYCSMACWNCEHCWISVYSLIFPSRRTEKHFQHTARPGRSDQRLVHRRCSYGRWLHWGWSDPCADLIDIFDITIVMSRIASTLVDDNSK